jgi:hypothetical protein
MKEFAIMDVLESGEDLEQYALDTVGIQWFVIARLHQLVKVAIHELHCNVQPAAVRVQENVQGRDEMRVWW